MSEYKSFYKAASGGEFEQVSVCEDVPEHFAFWRDCFNPNPEDCCNLRRAYDVHPDSE